MYILNKEEKAVLKTIIKNTRIDYYRKNKYFFREETIEDKVLYEEKQIEDEIMKKDDALGIKRVYNWEQIEEILFMERATVNKKRLRAIEKMKKKALKRGGI